MISKHIVHLAQKIFEDQERLILENGLYNGKSFNDRFCLNLANMLAKIFHSSSESVVEDLRKCITSSFRLVENEEEWDWRPYGEPLMKRYQKVVRLWQNAQTFVSKKGDSALYDFVMSDFAEKTNVIACTNNNKHSCTTQENMLRYLITVWNSNQDGPKEITGSGIVHSLQLFVHEDVTNYIHLQYYFADEVPSRVSSEIRNKIVVLEGGNIKPKRRKTK